MLVLKKNLILKHYKILMDFFREGIERGKGVLSGETKENIMI